MSTRAVLKTFYETNDFPTQGQFADFIDSAPNIDDDYAGTPAFPRIQGFVITAAQARTLNSVPIVMVAAPGAGFGIEVLAFSSKMNFVAPIFTLNSVLVITHAGATLAQMNVINQFGNTISTIRNGTRPTFFGADQTQLIENSALILTTSGDSALGGSDFLFTLTYQIIQL